MAKKPTKKIEDQAHLEEDALENLTDEEIDALAAELEDETEEEDSVDEGVSQADVDGTAGMENNYKTNKLSIAMKSLAGMDSDQINHFLASLDQIGHEADGVPGSASGHNQASVKMKGSPADIGGISSKGISEALKTALKEDLANVFGDSKDLTEEFKEKITTLFEAAVSYRVTAVEQDLTEKYQAAFETEIEELTENLIEKIDDYITFVGQEWLKENKVAVEKSLTNELAEDFITDLKALFEAHNISIPSEKVDVAEQLAAKVDELEEALNKTLEENMMLSEHVQKSERENLVTEFTTGMTLSQTEKFKQLIESIDYDGDDEAFTKKLEIVKNSHFKDAKNTKAKASPTNIITEEITYDSNDPIDPPEDKTPTDPTMKYYVSALSKAVKR